MAKQAWQWKFQDPIYTVDYLLLVCPAAHYAKEVERQFSSKIKPPEGRSGETLTLTKAHTPGIVIVIWFRNPIMAESPALHDLIAHEALHATLQVFDLVDVSISQDHAEPACYYLGWIVRQITERLGTMK